MYKLEWTFHIYDVNLEEKGTEKREAYCKDLVELLIVYRDKKNALLMESIKYNTDFKVYKVTLEMVDLDQINALLNS